MKSSLPYVFGGLFVLLFNLKLLLALNWQQLVEQQQLTKSGVLLLVVIVVTRMIQQKWWPDR